MRFLLWYVFVMETVNSSAAMPLAQNSIPSNYNLPVKSNARTAAALSRQMYEQGLTKSNGNKVTYDSANGIYYDPTTGLKFKDVTEGSTYRGFGSSIFNSANIKREDNKRAENAAYNQYQRDLKLLEEQYKYQRELRSTLVEDMKKQGLNPVLAYQNVGNTPSVSASRGNSSYLPNSGNTDPSSHILGILLQVVGGLISGGSSSVAKIGF